MIDTKSSQSNYWDTFPQYILFHPDIDECTVETDDCSQICINTVGSFDCDCNTGFVLDSDGSTCNGEYYMKHTHMFIQRIIICMYKMHVFPMS